LLDADVSEESPRSRGEVVCPRETSAARLPARPGDAFEEFEYDGGEAEAEYGSDSEAAMLTAYLFDLDLYADTETKGEKSSQRRKAVDSAGKQSPPGREVTGPAETQPAADSEGKQSPQDREVQLGYFRTEVDRAIGAALRNIVDRKKKQLSSAALRIVENALSSALSSLTACGETIGPGSDA
jgi:hypothetical protein